MTQQQLLAYLIAPLAVAVISALLLATVRGIASIRDNTAAIKELRQAFTTVTSAHDQLTARVYDLESWRNALTATLFRQITGP